MITIYTDLDGTLLTPDGLSSRTKEVCLEFQKGNRLVLATGRNYTSVKQFVKALKLEEYHGAMILMNGMVYLDFQDGERLERKPFTIQDVKKIVRIGGLLMNHVTIVTEYERYSCNVVYDYLFYFARLIIKHKRIPKIRRFREYPEKIMKVELISNFNCIFLKRLLQRLLRNYEVMTTGKRWIEVLPKGVGKADYVIYDMQKYQLNQKDVYAFGDGENDCTMLLTVENSYAVENALEAVKQAARYQCKSNQKEGVAQIIESIIRGYL